MSAISHLRSLAAWTFRRRRADAEMDEELRAHISNRAEDLQRAGIPGSEARRRARLEFGGFDKFTEECREERGGAFVDSVLQDIRFGIRMLRCSPGFTATAVLTLALGIGANAAIFSVVNAVLLRSLPYPNSHLLFTLPHNQSLPDLEDLQKQTQSFAAIGGLNQEALDFTGAGEPIQITGGLCNADLIRAAEIEPVLGRNFTPSEDAYGAPGTVILTYGFWTTHFGSDPTVLGRSIHLSGNAYTIIGVLPKDFWLPDKPVDVLVPLKVANPVAAQFRGVHFLETYLRLKPGATRAQADAEMQNVDAWLSSKYPEDDRDVHRQLTPLREAIFGDVRLELTVLFAAVGMVLLIACVNFASLQLARSASRQHEIAIRAALGASSGRLTRQMLTESALLSLLGGGAGLALAALGVHLLMLLKPPNLPRIEDTSLDGSVLAFTFLVSLMIGIVFGLAPAFSTAFSGLRAKLQGGQRSTAGIAAFRFRKLLVVSEIALALILLISATLIIRSFSRLHHVDPGIRADNILTMRLELPEARYREFATQRQFHQQLLGRLNGLPSSQAALISELPMSGNSLYHNMLIDGRPRPPVGEEPEVDTRTIVGDYFQIMRIPLLAGRDFEPQDHTGSVHVAVVNRAFALQYFGSQSPIGERVRWSREDQPDWMTIIGVVGDVRHYGPDQPEKPAVYDLYSQTAQKWKRWMYVVIRSEAPTGTVLAFAKQQLWAIDNQLPVTQVHTMGDVVAASLDHQRFILTLFSIFAAVALLLSALGIYGVIAYSVTQRTNEIGIRLALGAQSGDVHRLVLGEGLRLTIAGAALGIAASFLLTRFLSHLLFNISPHDPRTFVLIPLFLCAVALLACYLPSRRATRTDPVVALRYE